MSDSIGGQAAIDAIEKTKTVISEDGERYVAKINAQQNIALLPSAQQWIPCSERLPKNDDWVIVTIFDERGDTPFRYTDFGWYLKAANCWIVDGWVVDAEQRAGVAAWTPLPEPYQGEDE